VSTPEGEPSGTVVASTAFVQPKPKPPILIELKPTVLPVSGEQSWSWWATVDRHPFSDKRGYTSDSLALDAAIAWCEKNYPTRLVSLHPTLED
jgi:hypothetical protein